MGKHQTEPLSMTERQKQILQSMRKESHTSLHLMEQSSILLLFAESRNPSDIARELNMQRNTVYKWRLRLLTAKPELDRIEQESPRQLKAAREALLQDAPRPGNPAVFMAEQVAHMLEIYDIPLSHWTPSALAREVANQQIVPSISSHQVGDFLKRWRFEASSKPLWAASEHQG